MKRTHFQWTPARWAIIVIPLLLVGCQSLQNFTPERAALQEVLSSGMHNFVIDPNSIQVLQIQEFQDRTFVVVAFEGVRDNLVQQKCIAHYETSKSRLGTWMAGSGGSGCGPASEEGPPVDVHMGSASRTSREGVFNYTQAYGRVNQPDIVAVEVIWDDEEPQQVEVINGSYLVIRSGIHDLLRLHGLDGQGAVIYEYERPPLPDGKDLP